MKKYLTLMIASIFTSIALIGCGQQEQTPVEQEEPVEGEEQAVEEADLTQMSILLDWFPNAVHSYLYAAIENGYFEEEGIELEILFPTNTTDPINMVAAGSITLGISYAPEVIMARNKNVPVTSIAALVRSPLNAPMVLADSPIQSPIDFEGKTVGYSLPVYDAVIKTMVEADGGDYDKVNTIDIGFGLETNLIGGQVDATSGAFVNHEYPKLQYKGHDVRYFDPTDFGVPSYYELVIVTSEETLNNQRADIEAFWRAAVRGFEFMKNNPDEALDILFANQDEANFPLVREVEEGSLQFLLERMENENESFGSQKEAAWNEVIEWLLNVNIIEETPATDGIFVNLVD